MQVPALAELCVLNGYNVFTKDTRAIARLRMTDIDAETDVAVATVPDVRLAEMALQHQKLLQRAAEVAADTTSARAAADLESRLEQFDSDVASGVSRLNRAPNIFRAHRNESWNSAR